MENAVKNLDSAKKWHEKTRTVNNLLFFKIVLENVLLNDLYVSSNGNPLVWGV